jgi:hypothetical protein
MPNGRCGSAWLVWPSGLRSPPRVGRQLGHARSCPKSSAHFICDAIVIDDLLLYSFIARFKIAVLPGDGIGPEVIEQALRVLKAVSTAAEVDISVKSYDFGGIAIDKHGVPLPDDTLKACKEANGILLGESSLTYLFSLSGADIIGNTLSTYYTTYTRLRWWTKVGRWSRAS